MQQQTTVMLKKQRIVNKVLGKNNIKDHTRIYDAIEERIGKTRKCNFGLVRGSKTGVKHEGCQDVLIRNFDLRCAIINKENEVIIERDGLQSFCRNCSDKRRIARISQQKDKRQNKTPEEIYALYTQEYNTNVKKCSQCDIYKEIQCFYLSIGMECGLHNVCKVCSYEYGSSIGNRWIIYMPDGNYKYNKQQELEQHDDHIFPLSLGGSNEQLNHQLLSSVDNLKKSNILLFPSIADINPELITERFRNTLSEANDLFELKSILNQKIHNDILQRSRMPDDELQSLYKEYCKKNNLRKNIQRAIVKFREYCNIRFG